MAYPDGAPDGALAEQIQSQIQKLEGGKTEEKEDLKKWNKLVKKLVKDIDNLVADEQTSLAKKVATLHEKLVESINEEKKHERLYQTAQRKLEFVQKEKDHLDSELTKTVAVKTKLETLCKELQKQQKAIAAENTRIVEAESENRKKLQANFNETIEDIKKKMEVEGEARIEQARENADLRSKLKDIASRYEERDEILKEQSTKNSERMQLMDQQIQKQAGLYGEEMQKLITENEELKKTEKLLTDRVNDYSEKFVQFQDTLTKSNGMFEVFKSELDKARENLKKSETENNELRSKANDAAKTMIDLANEKIQLHDQLSKAEKKKEALEKLCKSLQAELSTLRKTDAE